MRYPFMLVALAILGCSETPVGESGAGVDSDADTGLGAVGDTASAAIADVSDVILDVSDVAPDTVADVPDVAPPDVAPDVLVLSACDPVPVEAADAASPTCPYFVKTWPCADLHVAALAAAPGGGFALAGTRAGVAWAARADALGHFIWQQAVSPVSGPALDVAAPASGGLVVVGGDASHGWIWRSDASGATAWLKTWTPANTTGGHGSPLHVVPTQDGGFVVGGPREDSSPAAGWLWRLDGQGQAVWEQGYPHDPTNKAINFKALAATSDGGFAFGGTWQVGANTLGHQLTRTDANGKQLWQFSSGDTIAAAAAGATLTVANSCGAQAFLLDAAGNATWSRMALPPQPGPCYASGGAYGAVALPGGDFIATGSASAPMLVRIAATGEQRWGLNLPAGTLSAPVLTANGVAFLTSNGADTGGQTLTSTDPWGNTSCAKSGACAGMSQSACSDVNPCSSDRCEAGQCLHSTAADKTNCGPGTGCADCPAKQWCTAGVCGN